MLSIFMVVILEDKKSIVEWANTKDISTVSIDTETTSLRYYELEIETIQIYNGDDAAIILYKDSLKAAVQYLFTRVDTVVAHNIAFDMKVLRKIGITLENCTLRCTMVADHLINENRPHGLKYLAERFLGITNPMCYKDARKYGLRSEEFKNYSVNDVLWTWQLYEKQKYPLERNGLNHLYQKIEMPFQRVLVDMEVSGMLVDVQTAEETTKDLLDAILNFKQRMCELLGLNYEMQFDLFGGSDIKCPINFNSSVQLAGILYDQLGLVCTELTETGGRKVDKHTLRKYMGESEFVKVLYKYKIAQKLLTAFFKPLPEHLDSDHKVRPNFHDVGTVTGRLSCSKPNLQQLPKVQEEFPVPVRNCFIAPPGYTMLTADYSGQEVAVMAEVSHDPNLVEALNKGQDMHLRIANQFFNLGIPEDALYKTHPDFDEYKEKFSKERTKSKVITFGLSYGKGAFGFSKDFGVTEEEAQKMVDRYFDAMPKLKMAIDQTHKELSKRGFVSSMTGRRRRFYKDKEGRYSGSAYRQSFNFKIQGYSADMIRMAMVEIRRRFKEHPEMDFQFVATVHDEVVAVVKTPYSKQAGSIVKDAMESVVNFCVPVVADVGFGDNYEEAK